jgi:hypothetical protein
MYVAELKGKLSTALERSEDILTSNVFSFFKYAARTVYLQKLLSQLDITPTHQELEQAEFIFWPTFDDGTEPDLVIRVGRYYVLFEAKYLSGFGEESDCHAAQLVREFEGGLAVATADKREFLLVAITAHSTRPTEEFAGLPANVQSVLKWINWQAVARILLEELEPPEADIPDRRLAQDLYHLLDRRKLRGFLSFNRLAHPSVGERPDYLFFNPRSATYRGLFIGFHSILANTPGVEKRKRNLFFSKLHFRRFPHVQPPGSGPLFFTEVRNDP